MVRISLRKFSLLCLTIVLISYSYFWFNCGEECPTCRKEIKAIHEKTIIKDNQNLENEGLDWVPHTLAVIIPFRDRFEEIMDFVPWIHKFLNNQKVRHKIVVVNQVDSYRFNRASLINIGFIKTMKECDYMVMHDVDLLPNNDELHYYFPEEGPYHLASPEYHPIYHYKNYIGGILMLTNEHFKKCRGMSNIFWGWGREDDELFLRFKDNGLNLYRPTGLTTGYETFIHNHDKQKRPRDYNRYGDQKKVQFRRDPITGYDTVQYEVESTRDLTIDNAPFTIYNVKLICDEVETPWCKHSPKQKQ